MTSVSEVIVNFLQLILFANTAALFCSLLGLVSHSFLEGDSDEEISTRWHCVEKSNHLHVSSLVFQPESGPKPGPNPARPEKPGQTYNSVLA